MYLSDFDYHLPPECIAQTPAEPRDHSKLLMLSKNTGEIQDAHFYNIADYLGSNDVLVVNNTRVINARLKGLIVGSETQAEIFLHKQISENSWDCLVYPGKKLKPGKQVALEPAPGRTGPKLIASIKDISESGRIVEFSLSGDALMQAIENIGETPLPPYIKQKNNNPERYQTAYNKYSGSVAAPTAGLHFTPELLETLKNNGVQIEEVLLHVGLGTFKNVEVDDITQHTMHKEYISLHSDVATRLNNAKKAGKRIICVGTTSVRVIESFSDDTGVLHSGEMETGIFIYPGYSWKYVDSIITNFHLPKSTLLMLVSSFAGKQSIESAYAHAIKNQYRFFSFGDAMWIQ